MRGYYHYFLQPQLKAPFSPTKSSIKPSIAGFAGNLAVFFIGLTLIEIAYGAIRIVIYGHLYAEIDQKHRSTVNSMLSAVQTLGGAVSLLVMGELADIFSPQSTLAVGATLILLVLLLTRIKSSGP